LRSEKTNPDGNMDKEVDSEILPSEFDTDMMSSVHHRMISRKKKRTICKMLKMEMSMRNILKCLGCKIRS
jgi:hypothetical protein